MASVGRAAIGDQVSADIDHRIGRLIALIHGEVVIDRMGGDGIMRRSVPIPIFPLTYTSDEGIAAVLADRIAVETWVEENDDRDSCRCQDAAGRRVRLVLWSLRLLVCQCVPDDFEPERLELVAEEGGSSGRRIVECFAGLPLRALVTGQDRDIAEPGAWSQTVPGAVGRQSTADLSVTDFHRRWLAARLHR